MAKARNLNCRNEWWNSYGKRVLSLLSIVEEKRFQNSYEGDVNYTEIIFILQGLMFALEKAQLEADSMKAEIVKVNSYKEAIESLNKQIIELKKEHENYEIETEVTISNLEHELEKLKKNDKDIITD